MGITPCTSFPVSLGNILYINHDQTKEGYFQFSRFTMSLHAFVLLTLPLRSSFLVILGSAHSFFKAQLKHHPIWGVFLHLHWQSSMLSFLCSQTDLVHISISVLACDSHYCVCLHISLVSSCFSTIFSMESRFNSCLWNELMTLAFTSPVINVCQALR